ncbi:hypothetical protein [Variovorax saccharolyticus]|uniref:hypothetical protein n=1 Tax=Variovorax saccharolyticus TaxID=3053516 RepID=UPI002576E468|nr:hypothetical protein [Variovorax sp. J22R187]MDM0018016.1 hypothetical protein [Variovorax sp. J22R187]
MDYRPNYKELEEARRWKEEEAYRTYHPARPGLSHMMPHLLRSGAFTAGAPSGHVSAVFQVHRHDSLDELVHGQEVRYEGPQLGQFHKRVLLGLLLLAAGRDADVTLAFTADEFLRSVGRDVCTSNVKALRRVLSDLRAATFTVTRYAGDSGEVFGFISEADWLGRAFTVTMSRRFASALETLGRTYIPMHQRNLLADGLQTALADLIWATKGTMIQVADLAVLWGREPVQLGREITHVLGKLCAAGVLTSFRRRRGKFEFERATKHSS